MKSRTLYLRARSVAGRARRALARRYPSFRRLATTVFEQPIIFSGSYRSWEDALRVSAGYDAPLIFDRVRKSAALVRDGKALFERDGVAFHEAEPRWPLLGCLLRVAATRGQRLHVLDFGGSLGSTYFQCRPLLACLQQLRWSVVEQPHYVECGRTEFQTQELRFYPRAEDCVAEAQPDVLLISGVLQALPTPYESLQQLLALKIENVLLDRTPLLLAEEDRLTIEHVPPHILGVSSTCPAWFFSRTRLEKTLAPDHELVTEFKALDRDAALERGVIGRFVGQHWARTALPPVNPTPRLAPALGKSAGRGRGTMTVRVAVLHAVQDEKVGGGFVYEHGIFPELLRQIPLSSHDFVILGQGRSLGQLPERCQWLELPSDLAPQLQPSWSGPAQTRFLRERGIQFVLHLNPFAVMASDIPYLAVVWDLQHRVQPFFPEVSAEGEWSRRQQHFSSVLPRATWIVTGTEAGKRQIETLFGVLPERIAVSPIPTPLDALEHKQRPVAETLQKHGLVQPFLFYPAQFWSHKNHFTLLQALRVLGENHGQRPSLVFTGADYGNLEHVISSARAFGLSEQVRHLGFLPREEILHLYGAATALVYPSLFGPDNIPPLEAFALGCPVVAGAIHGASEYLGDAAILVEPLDAQAWAAAINSVLTDYSVRERLIGAGHLRAPQFTPADTAALLLSLVDRFASVRSLWG